jgi:hypothetical protein
MKTNFSSLSSLECRKLLFYLLNKANTHGIDALNSNERSGKVFSKLCKGYIKQFYHTQLNYLYLTMNRYIN